MNFFRRAIRYRWRQKIRSIILLLVFTLLSSAALTALSVGHATEEGTADVKKTISTDTENFDLISNPLTSLQTLMDTAVIVIAVTGAAIIVLLLVLWTRSRKKEAGILIAVGQSKVEIVLQFLTENILVTIPSAAVSLGLTALLADKVGAYLVSQTTNDNIGLDVILHSADIAAVYGIGALILILAVFLAAVTVVRLKPRMILSDME